MNQLLKKSILVVLAVFSMNFFATAAKKPNSKFAGVQIGAITYSYRDMPDQSLEAILNYTVQSGISSVELMGDPVEKYAGIPEGGDAETLRRWRTSVSMDKFKEIKKMFKARGVKIHILKLGKPNWSDEELDYAFNVCKILGAKGISTEISEYSAKRMAPFADKHKLYVLLHNHQQPANPDFSFDKILAYGPRLILNLDVGHYYGCTGMNPCDLMKRLHSRIFTIHLKDKTGPNGTPRDVNRPFGEGQTPLVEILQLIRDEKWPIVCDIEFEYNPPKGSDPVKEFPKIVDYCRTALLQK